MQTHMAEASLQREMVAEASNILRTRYGADAARVARRQLLGAQADGRAAWQAILDRLSI